MNKIVREYYPAALLPDDLRDGLDGSVHVRIVIETQESLSESEPAHPPFLPTRTDRSVSGAEMLEKIRVHKAKYGTTTTEEEAVRRIRDLRDEWDDE
ncbi:hypothetical protein [Rhizobium sp. PP-CC-3G-465]|uniref:hypothetical protein n=1 Tax=Rhizobium sp. PP-CC-3G-465 TaxID=2135648 RepID=UPI0010454A57|nr:hypothetical protein C8J33_1012380 [Rhizobium sp. PP-CC-3G-465]